MPTASITINTRRMVYGSPFKRMSKAVEHIHYLTLFSLSTPYAGTGDPWLSWQEDGTDLAVREAPSAARQPDRVTISVTSTARSVVVRATSENTRALDRTVSLVRHINELRPLVQGKDEAARLEVLISDKAMLEQLVTPVTKALGAKGLREDEQETFPRLINGALIALTDPDITTIDFVVAKTEARV